MTATSRSARSGRITSPEGLHDYIHVTSPNLWILLVLIIALLAATIVLACTLTIENTLDVQLMTFGAGEDGRSALMSGDLTDDRRSLVRTGMTVRVAGEEGTIQETVSDDEAVLVTVSLNRGEARLKEGTYDGTIVLQTTTPISFLLKK